MRQISLDTETTGLSYEQGHRLTEIGCIEIIDRQVTGKKFHTYLNPEREVDHGAVKITGLTNEFLADKPKFVDIADDFIKFIEGSELIIHNAPFDVGFINNELKLIKKNLSVSEICTVIDTLILARSLHPGQRNSLDALCKRYQVDNSDRDYHGALLDAKILVNVYLSMTKGQRSLEIGNTALESRKVTHEKIVSVSNFVKSTISEEELQQHTKYLEFLNQNNNCQWLKLEE